MVASSHLWLFKCKFKIIKIKNSVPQLHYPHFKCSVTTYYHVDNIATEHFHHVMFFGIGLLEHGQGEVHVEWV